MYEYNTQYNKILNNILTNYISFPGYKDSSRSIKTSNAKKLITPKTRREMKK